MSHGLFLLFGNPFTPDDVPDGYPVDCLMHGIAFALMTMQTQITEILGDFSTMMAANRPPAGTEKSKKTPRRAFIGEARGGVKP